MTLPERIQEVRLDLSRTYRHAAAADLKWKHEFPFFLAQLKRNYKILAAVQNGVPATIESVKVAVHECAAMGLSMSPNAQLVYFIPRRARRRYDGESQSEYEAKVPWLVTATPSYRGLAYIATNFAGAELVAAEVVFRADSFRYFGPINEPEHEATTDNAQRHEGDGIGAYAVVRMRNGSVRAEYTDEPTIRTVRQMSEFPNGLMWTKFWTEGWRKVPIRRICKTVMVSNPQMGAAIEVLNKNEGIILDEPPPPPPNGGGVDGLTDAMRRVQHPDPAGDDVATYQGLAITQATNPPGSIEFWVDELRAADSLERMDDIKVAALADGVDRGEHAATFRSQFTDQCKRIRGIA